jgi:photosystem II stability/assembly factor-like uncharacterized protein
MLNIPAAGANDAGEKGAAPDDLDLRAATGPEVQRAVLLDATRAGTRIVAVGERGIVLLSDDEGETWRQGVVPVQVTLTAVTFADERNGWIVGHDALVLGTSDAGASWTRLYADPGLEAPLLDVSFTDPLSGIAVGGRGNLFVTRDAGKTWEGEVIYGADEFDGHLFDITRAPGALFLAAEAGAVQRSLDGGATWQLLDTGYNGSFFGLMALRTGRLLAYGMLGNIRYSDDGGNTWQAAQAPVGKSLLTGVELADGRVVLGGLDGALVISADGGTTFVDEALPDRVDIAKLLPLAGERWLILGERGLQRATLNLH